MSKNTMTVSSELWNQFKESENTLTIPTNTDWVYGVPENIISNGDIEVPEELMEIYEFTNDGTHFIQDEPMDDSYDPDEDNGEEYEGDILLTKGTLDFVPLGE